MIGTAQGAGFIGLPVQAAGTMSLIAKLKSLLGLGSRRDERGTAVRVEREPAARSERAVKEPVESTESSPETRPAEPTAEPEREPAPSPESPPEPSADAAADEAEPETAPEPEPEPEREPEPEPAGADAEPVQTISGIGPAYAERLAEAGIETVDQLASADPAELAEATGLGEGRVSDWIERANDA